MKISLISTPSGIAGIINGQTFNVDKTHINYERILKALREDKGAQALKLMNVKKALFKFVSASKRVRIENDKIRYRGKELHGVLVKRIIDMIAEGKPFKHMVRFLENLEKNPDPDSRQMLYGFLEHLGLPITENGTFVAWKWVTEDYKDHKTKTFCNKPGRIVKEPRDIVTKDPNVHCARGLHVGTFEYAKTFQDGGRVMLVEVNPKNAVSVPNDHNCQKLRVCEYKVISEVDHKTYKPILSPVVKV